MSGDSPVKISVVSPVYGCGAALPELVRRLRETLERITRDYEIILVNDGSPDDAWEVIVQLASEDSRIKGISLSRNFGQHPVVLCGLHHARGEVTVIIDCDLQEDPEYIPLLYAKYQEGYAIVYTLRTKRAHGFIRNLLAKYFYMVYKYLTDNPHSKVVGTHSTLMLASRKVVNSFLNIKDVRFQYLLIFKWLGFSSTYIEISYRKRKFGKLSYSFAKMFNVDMDGILFHSDKLLRLNILLGISFSIIAILALLYIVITYYISGYAKGWASIAALILFATSIILWSVGIVGLYVGKVFEQVKQRTVYIVDKKINL
jgi:glycosyltransferase involved in cell wall biosynthesis